MDELANQNFNGGIIFVSYLVSTAGAMTTLEMLSQRTHYKGALNWTLLMAAAFCMGAVGIWSMHFIGNHSLQLSYKDAPTQYQLDYNPGYTFASLFVAIGCMFVAFAFVGITEKAHYIRIISSGIVAGCSIALMHYLGQFAIEFFIVEYKTPYVVGAIIIACVAVTAALCIFFKLREQWANQWYKRLGCAMLMAVAVTGMHYTAMAGTEYRRPAPDLTPPTPAIPTGALIGIIVAVVVLGCGGLLYLTVFRYRRHQTPLDLKKPSSSEKRHKRLLLEFVLFDNAGHILVQNDGLLPSKLVMDPLILPEDLTASHPLFLRLFDTTKQWALHDDTLYSDHAMLQAYLQTAQRFAEDLKLPSLADLGMLFDTVIHAQPPSPKSNRLQRTPSAARRLLSRARLSQAATTQQHAASKQVAANGYPATSTTLSDMEMQVDGRMSISSTGSSSSDDQHIFLVRQVGGDQELAVSLLARGYRFADPVFIARIMGAKLRLPTDTMLCHFRDMQYMADLPSAPNMWTTPCHHDASAARERCHTGLPARVYVGLMILVEHGSEFDVVVDEQQRFSFPVVPLDYDQDDHAALGHDEKTCISNWRKYSLSTVASLSSQLDGTDESSSTVRRGGGGIFSSMALGDSNSYYGYYADRHQQQTEHTHRFVRALGAACQQLMDKSSYGRAFATTAKLHGDILEIPPFALAADACELILFRAVVNNIPVACDNTIALSHNAAYFPVKCIPLPLYKSLACHVTDQAVELYRHGRRGGANESIDTLVEMPVMVMPSQARFLWLDLIVADTLREYGRRYRL